jgi:hypothetical protein
MSLSLPPDVENPVALADWVELRACLNADGNVSAADVRQALVAAGEPDESDAGDADDPAAAATGGTADPPRDEVLAAEAFTELGTREIAAGAGYPFRLEQGLLRRVAAPTDVAALPYVFCLLLSWRANLDSDAPPKAERMFEEVCGVTLQSLLAGDLFRFGFPRSHLPKTSRDFFPALTELCAVLKEGAPRATVKEDVGKHKDGDLDLVAWKSFPDGRPGQLIIFGQCAAGRQWATKLLEGAPTVFQQRYLSRVPAVLPVKAFFTPFRIRGGEEWRDHCARGGLLFDRCRIAGGATQNAGSLQGTVGPWVTGLLNDLSNPPTTAGTRRPRAAKRGRKKTAAKRSVNA